MAFGSAVIGGALGSAFGSDAKDEMERQAQLDWLATQEQVRRMEEEQEDIIGTARADVGASGFTSGSQSQQQAIANTEREMARSRNLTLAFGEAQYQSRMRAADKFGYSNILSGASQGLRLSGQISEWFA